MPRSTSKPQWLDERTGAQLRAGGVGLLLLAGLLGSTSVLARMETRVELALPRGQAVSARIQVPRGADEQAPLPAVMLFGGLGSVQERMLVALAAYAAYVINAGQFLMKLRAARLEASNEMTVPG